MLIAIAVQHAAAEHAADFTDFMYKVVDSRLPCRSSGASPPLRKPEWSTRLDDVITLVEAERGIA